MKSQLEGGNFRIRGFYPAVNVRYVAGNEIARFDGPGKSFVNLNTPEEFAGIELKL